MYTIKVAAELTGVPEATLRAWERRYSIVEPFRTPSGYRLYDDSAIGRIARMRRLIDDGWAVREAARQVRETPASSAMTLDHPPVDHSADETDLIRVMLRAAADLDEAALEEVLDDRFGSSSFEHLADTWLMPAVTQVGIAWESGDLTVAGEHMASNAIMRRLGQAFDAAARVTAGPRIIVGLPAECRHEVGALAFAVAARRIGLDVTYLGADLPTIEWANAVREAHVDGAVLTVPRGSDLMTAHAAVRAINEASPDTLIAGGGGAQEDLPPPTVTLGHHIAPAAARLRSLLDERRTNSRATSSSHSSR